MAVKAPGAKMVQVAVGAFPSAQPSQPKATWSPSGSLAVAVKRTVHGRPGDGWQSPDERTVTEGGRFPGKGSGDGDEGTGGGAGPVVGGGLVTALAVGVG